MVDFYKHSIRRTILSTRKQLSPNYQQMISTKVCARVRKLNQYRHAKRIALYQATGGEIDLDELWRSAPLQGKFCYFPVLNPDKTLSFLPATPATPFQRNKYGIDEPMVALTEAILPQDIDLIFVPVVGFDHQCNRLGMGSGYYDRTLATVAQDILIGVAYDFQLQPYIPQDPWDIPVGAVITQNKIYWKQS